MDNTAIWLFAYRPGTCQWLLNDWCKFPYGRRYLFWERTKSKSHNHSKNISIKPSSVIYFYLYLCAIPSCSSKQSIQFIFEELKYYPNTYESAYIYITLWIYQNILIQQKPHQIGFKLTMHIVLCVNWIQLTICLMTTYFESRDIIISLL